MEIHYYDTEFFCVFPQRGYPKKVFQQPLDLKNDSMLPRYVLFSPLVSLAKILAFLCENEISEEKQRNFVDAVKKQRVFQIIYFPPKPGVVDESLIFLDQIYSQPLLHFKRNPKSKL